MGGWVGEARRIGKTLKCWHAKKKKTKQKIHSNKYNQSTWRGRHMHLKVGAGGGWWGWVRCYGGLRQLATLNHLRMCACVLADHVC